MVPGPGNCCPSLTQTVTSQAGHLDVAVRGFSLKVYTVSGVAGPITGRNWIIRYSS